MLTTIRGSRIDFEWREPQHPVAGRPVIVFLHEGLGSLAMWKDFPQAVADATGCRALVYSRAGYGHSEPRRGPRSVRYMHTEALETLPALLDVLHIDNPVLLGHSDGGSIALIFAGGTGRPLVGVIVMAPHVLVEPLSVSSIAAARETFLTTDLREKLRRYHDDPESVFWGWNDIWLDPAFRSWDIQEYLLRIDCPVLAIQGEDDEYGTMEQIRLIGRYVPRAQLLELSHCGHSAHRDQPVAVTAAVVGFIDSLSAERPPVNSASNGPGLPSSKPCP